jgi:hypothetical protein
MRRNFAASSGFGSSYSPGDTISSTFCFQLMNGNLDLTQAVLRFDIVNASGQSVLQQGSAIINTNTFTLSPDLTEPRTFFSKARMQEGVTVRGNFTFTNNAPAGGYRTVISVVPTSGNNVPSGSTPPIVSFSFPFTLN